MTPEQLRMLQLRNEEERQRANMAAQQGLMDRLASGPNFVDGAPAAITPTPQQAQNLQLQQNMSPASLQRQQNFMRGMQEIQAATEAQAPRNVPQKSLLGSIGSFFGDRARDPAYMARLAAGLQSMTLNPNQQFIKSQLQRAGDIQESRQAARETNQTAQYLRSIGRDDLARVIEQNPSLAATILQSMFDPSKGVVVQEGDRVINPTTGEVIFGGEPQAGFTSKQRDEAGKLVKDYVGNAATKDFQKQAGAYTRVVQSAKNPSGAGDLALIFNFMKVLDPGSVVRESEFATAAGARAELTRAEESGEVIPAIVAQAMQRFKEGTRLLPEQRQDFVKRAGMLYQGAVEQHAPFRSFYAEKVEAIAPGFGLPPIGYSGEVSIGGSPDSSEAAQVLSVPPSNWDGTNAGWLSLSDKEKQEYIQGQ